MTTTVPRAKLARRALVISVLNEAYPDLSQREVAAMLGVTRNTVGRTLLRTGTAWARRAPCPNSLRDVALVAEAMETGRSLRAIGLDYGITRERVRQILAKAGVKKAHARWTSETHYRCSACGKPRRSWAVGRCQECWRAATPRITQPCAWCGKPVTRTLAVVSQHMRATGKDTTTLFCNRTCFGQWLGHNHGVQRGGLGRGRRAEV